MYLCRKYFKTMLNRRILRIKAFKVAFSSALNGNFSTAEAEAELKESCEATRDLFVFMSGIVVPLTQAAVDRIESLRSKFNPTEEERNPNMKFCENRLAQILEDDGDLKNAMKRRGFSWEQYDIFLRKVLDSVYSKKYFRDYMNSGESSLAEDCRLFVRIFEEEFSGVPELEHILEDMSLYWNDDLEYALTCCCRAFEDIAKGGRWSLPYLYRSQMKGSEPGVEDDQAFVRRLLQLTLVNYGKYSQMVYDSAKGWDADRLFLSDVVLVVMGLAEIMGFPNIPVRVSMNEYVEISKYYGTPKSRVFVNGILDRIVKKLMEEGQLTKE